jgi:hypothetical protein
VSPLFRRRKAEPNTVNIVTTKDIERMMNMPPTTHTTTDLLADPDLPIATHHCTCGVEMSVTRNDPRPWERHTHPARTEEQMAKDARRNAAFREHAGVATLEPPPPESCSRCGGPLPVPGATVVIPNGAGPSVHVPADGTVEHKCSAQAALPHEAAAAQFLRAGIEDLLRSGGTDAA